MALPWLGACRSRERQRLPHLSGSKVVHEMGIGPWAICSKPRGCFQRRKLGNRISPSRRLQLFAACSLPPKVLHAVPRHLVPAKLWGSTMWGSTMWGRCRQHPPAFCSTEQVAGGGLAADEQQCPVGGLRLAPGAAVPGAGRAEAMQRLGMLWLPGEHQLQTCRSALSAPPYCTVLCQS